MCSYEIWLQFWLNRVSVFIGNISAQHVDNDCQHSMVHCVEILSQFLVNLLFSINKIITVIKILLLLLYILQPQNKWHTFNTYKIMMPLNVCVSTSTMSERKKLIKQIGE